MPDKKISELVDGAPPQNADEYVIARAGSNFSLSYGAMTSGGVSSLSGVGAVTVATNGSTISIGAPAQTVQTQNLVALTLDGNTAGVLALASSGTVTLAGGNNITLSQAGNAITISGANVGGAQTGISGIVGSDASYTSGTVTFSGVGGGVTVNSNTGQRIDISVAAQSVQPETQTFIAGISASDTLYTSGNVRLTGVGGGVTVSSNTGQRVDISVAAQSVQPETQTFIAGISASDTLYTSGNVRFTGVGGGITVSSNTGQRVDLSVAAQSVQPETQTFIAGISASDTLYTSGNVRFTGSQAVTVRSGTGQLVVIDAPSQTTQTQGILSVGVSTGGNTAGNTQVSTGSRFVLVASGNATASQATAAGASTITISVGTQTVQTQGILSAGVSTGGNTAGNTQVSTGSRLVIVGSNGITASQGTAAGATTITLSGITQSVQTQGILSAGVSTGGNTAGNTQVSTGSRLVIVGSNGITASQGTAAGATTITLSGITQSVQTNDIPRMGVSTGGNTAGDTTVNSGTRLVFVGSNNITLSQGTAASATTITISGPTTAAQSVQTQGILNVALSNIGNTAGDTGINSGTRMVLAGGNNITLSASSAANATTITISAPNAVAQTNQAGSVYAISNTSGTSSGTYDARTLSIAGAGLVTIAASNSGWRVDATNQNLSAGVSNVGNTSGNTTVNTGSRLVFAGGNNITLSQGTAAGATTITISAPNLGAGAFSGGASNLGNTAGDTGITGTRLIMVGSNNITLSQATDANGGTLSIIGGGGGGFSGGVSTGGNTAGATGITGTQNVFVGVSPMSLSQTTGANGGTISILAPATSSLSATGGIQISTNGSTISIGDGGGAAAYWENMAAMQPALYTLLGGVSKTPFYWPENLPQGIQPKNIAIRVSMVTANTDLAMSVHFGIYTFVNSTSVALLGSASDIFHVSSASSVSFSAQRNLVLTSPGTHTAISSLSAGNYLFGMMFSAAATQSMNASIYAASGAAGPRIGRVMPGTNQLSTATSQGIAGLYGRGSTTVNALPANVVASEVVNQGIGASSPMKPYIFIRS